MTVTNEELNQKIRFNQLIHDVSIKTSENNTYADNVRRTAILLQSEASVATGNAKKVIEIVANHIFDYQFSESLPCAQSCLNMNIEGLVISNFQVAERVLESNNVTLHLDGKSRDHKKVVCHQFTIDDGTTLYLDFTPVATEDSDTILDVTIALLKKVCKCYSDLTTENTDQIFLKFLRKISRTTSDRAATMKCFDSKLENFLKSELGSDFKISFLHCNAHFFIRPIIIL